MADDDAFISIRELGFSYAQGTRPALADINLDIRQAVTTSV